MLGGSFSENGSDPSTLFLPSLWGLSITGSSFSTTPPTRTRSFCFVYSYTKITAVYIDKRIREFPDSLCNEATYSSSLKRNWWFKKKKKKSRAFSPIVSFLDVLGDVLRAVQMFYPLSDIWQLDRMMYVYTGARYFSSNAGKLLLLVRSLTRSASFENTRDLLLLFLHR